MALTLDQYATYLDTRGDLNWPAPPAVERPKAKPHLERLPNVRAVLWNVYGALIAVTGGELVFEHPQQFVMDIALDKTIQEFKMWASMVRKPGQPTDYLRRVYTDLLTELRMQPSAGEKHPEIAAERLWEGFIKKLLQKEYKFDAGFYGSLNQFSQKVAYFFHASLQTPGGYPGLAEALRLVKDASVTQGLLADGQCFTTIQLQRCIAKQGGPASLADLVDPTLCFISYDLKARKPSDKLFKHALHILSEKGIAAEEILHVGSRIEKDIAPAKRHGMKTALFAGDAASLAATREQLRDSSSRPDVMLTELTQIADVVGY